MRTLLFVSLLCGMTVASAEIYRWTDANGKQVYGDEPPENARAVEAIELPTLTVAERFKTNAKPNGTQAPIVSKESVSESEEAITPATASSEPQQSNHESAVTGYTGFSILEPKTDELVRSNAGEFTVHLAIQPALKQGHGVVIYVDGRQVGETTQDSIEITGIDRGEHSVFAVLHDAQDNILGNTAAVNFTVTRTSVASSAKNRSTKPN